MDKKLYSQIAKFLSGNATEAEAGALLRQLDNNSRALAIFEELKAYWDATGQLPGLPERDENAAWLEFKTLAAEEDKVKPLEENRPIWSIAAGIALLALLSVVISYFINGGRDNKNNLVAIYEYPDPVVIKENSNLPEFDTLEDLSDEPVIGVKRYRRKAHANEVVNVVMITVNSGDSARVFLLPDNTIVYLNEHSTLTYPENFNKTNRKLTLIGEAFFEVARDTNQFVVACQNTVVRGTSPFFNVRGYEKNEDVEVIVVSGNLEFSGVGKRDYKKLELKKGESGIYTKEDELYKTKTLRKDYKWWQKKGLRLRLKQLLEKIKRTFGQHESTSDK